MRDQPEFPADAERRLFTGGQFPAGNPRKPTATDTGFAASVHRVLAVLTRHQNQIGETRVSQRDISDEASVPYIKVKDCLQALVKERRVRIIDAGRGRKLPTYRIVTPAVEIGR